MGNNLFSGKTIQTSLYLICIINWLQSANEPLAKDVLRLCPDLPIHYKSLVTLSSVKCAFLVLFDFYAVSISFRTIN